MHLIKIRLILEKESGLVGTLLWIMIFGLVF